MEGNYIDCIVWWCYTHSNDVFAGSTAPKDVAARIVAALPDNPLIGEAVPAVSNNFILLPLRIYYYHHYH